MSRKNTILGLGALAAFGFASMAFAQCPSSPVPPWSGVAENQGSVAIQAGGLGGTSCHMESSISAGAGPFATATVRDDTPADEPRYRGQFIIDTDALTGMGLFDAVTVFSAETATAHAGSSDLIRAVLTGGSTKRITLNTLSEGSPGNVVSVGGTLSPGENVIEFDWQQGSPGSLKLWINNGDESTPTDQNLNLNNASWGGVDFANLGLAAANNLFRTGQAGKAVKLDEFDSRRSTFIGL